MCLVCSRLPPLPPNAPPLVVGARGRGEEEGSDDIRAMAVRCTSPFPEMLSNPDQYLSLLMCLQLPHSTFASSKSTPIAPSSIETMSIDTMSIKSICSREHMTSLSHCPTTM